MIKNKKASLPPMEVTIGIIVLIVSIIIIALIWRNLFLDQQTAQQVCYASIVARAAATAGPIEFKDSVNVKCKTSKICFISGNSGEGCPSLGKEYTKVQVNGDKDLVLDAIAEDIYQWHTTLGEGKVNFMPRSFLANKYCMLNSIISFDSATKDALSKPGAEINQYDVYVKMYEKETDDGRSYLSVVYGGENLENIRGLRGLEVPVSKDSMIVSSIEEEGTASSWAGIVGAAGIVIVGVVTFPIWGPAVGITSAVAVSVISLTPLALQAGTIAGGSVYIFGRADPNSKEIYTYVPPSVYTYDSDTLKALKCDSFETLG
jgi:hypothetical protein